MDSRLNLDGKADDAVVEAMPRRFDEEALDGLEPRAQGRHRVAKEASVAFKPGHHLRLFVITAIVENYVNGFFLLPRPRRR